MSHNHDHKDIISSLRNEYAELLDASEQGIYIYLDDEHKICNKNFASLLGYASANEWEDIDAPFTEAFVADASQEPLVDAFGDALEKGVASTSSITWKKKNGGTVETTVILVPIVFEGHLFALHFVSA
jgi:hypothetical protein